MTRLYFLMIVFMLIGATSDAGQKVRVCRDVGELSTLLHCSSDSPKAGCKQVASLDRELNCDEDQDDSFSSSSSGDKDHDFLMKRHFGPSACLASNLVEEKTAELTRKCEEWTGQKQKELGKKYRTSTCEDSCSDCGSGLKKCEINGVIHYRSN